MNLSELHKLLDLLVVQRTVLSVVLADEVLKDTQCKISYCASFQTFAVHFLQFRNKTRAHF